MTRYAVLFATLLLAAPPVHAGTITVTERLVDPDAAFDRDPVVFGATTVWMTERGGTRDIIMRNADQVLSGVVFGPGHQDQPAIYGDNVVWVDDSLGNPNIGVTDLTTGARRLLTVDAARDTNPAISGTTVVFESDRGGTSDILGFDLATDRLFLVAGGPGEERLPTIDGSFVAWSVFQNGSFDIMATDIGGTPFLVDGSAQDAVFPSVSGNRIAYLSDGNVMVYDRLSATTTPITQDAFRRDSVNPVKIWGNLVTWTDDRNGNRDIFVHDLTDGTTYQVTSDPSDQTLGDLTDDRLVFYDRRLGGFDIWQLTLAITPTPGSTPVPVPGTLLLIVSGAIAFVVSRRKVRRDRR